MTQTTIRLADYQPASFHVEHLHLFFDLFDDHAMVKAVMKMQRVQHTPTPLILQGEDMTLVSIAIDGQLLSPSMYVVDDQCLTILTPPEHFTLETVVKIKPQDNTQLMGLYQSRGNFCTQCEPHGFRRITYFLDRPDVLTQITTTITADQSRYPQLLSNGNLIETEVLDDGRHSVVWSDPSLKPCYLFALVAGDFDVLEDTYETISGRAVDLKLYVEKGYAHQADFALTSLKNSMQWDEERWGREYDLDIYMIVAVSDFNMGAMENKGLNIFNTKYVLAEPQTATDTDYINIEKVIGHEYFHNWTGNRITCRDWFQITLKEGLTVFRDQEFTADMQSRPVARIQDASIIMTRQFEEDGGPLAHPIRPESYIEVNNFYTVTVYNKGAEVIRMIETLITPPVFRQGLDVYFERHDGQAVTTEDFIACMEAASHHDLTQFKRWYAQAGTPVVNVTDHYDEALQAYTLTVKQSCPSTSGQPFKAPFYFPFAIGLVGTNQADTQVLVIDDEEQTFTFNQVDQRPVPSLLRDFTAPVKCHYDYSDDDLVYLLLNDTDPFARWNAGQQWMSRIVIRLSQQVMMGAKLSDPVQLVSVFKQLIEQPCDDLNFLAVLLSFPSESFCHQQCDLIHVQAMHAAYQFTIQAISTGCYAAWESLYHDCYQQGAAYTNDATAVARRRMQNLCLYYCVQSENRAGLALAESQYKDANNMSDRLGALLALNAIDCAERNETLASFYEDWKSDPLVVNKWLTLQATAPFESTLNTVQAIAQADYFDLNNPNMIYALMCAFTANTAAFHVSSGAAYRWVADQVVNLDSKNPQVAARLVQALTAWQRLAAPQRDLMLSALKQIAGQPSLSSDVYEIVTKSI